MLAPIQLSHDPQVFPIPIWIYNVASRLARYHDVVVYAPRGYHQEKVEYFHGMKYRRIPTTFDTWLRYMVQGASKRFPGFDQTLRKRPYFASIFNYFTYILKVTKDLKTEKCDIAHIHEESEFISILSEKEIRSPPTELQRKQQLYLATVGLIRALWIMWLT